MAFIKKRASSTRLDVVITKGKCLIKSKGRAKLMMEFEELDGRNKK